MKVYAVADIHAKPFHLDTVEDNIVRHAPDLLVIAGDLVNYFRPAPTYSRLNNLPVPVFTVRGNTDTPGQEKRLGDYDNIQSLHMTRLEIQNFFFCGISGCVPVPFRSRIRWAEHRLLDQVGPMVDSRTVLVVHPPPFGSLDRVMGRFSAGSKLVREIVRKRCPRVLLCGHIHEEPGISRLNHSLVVNCAMSRQCGGALLKLDADGTVEADLI